MDEQYYQDRLELVERLVPAPRGYEWFLEIPDYSESDDGVPSGTRLTASGSRFRVKEFYDLQGEF